MPQTSLLSFFAIPPNVSDNSRDTFRSRHAPPRDPTQQTRTARQRLQSFDHDNTAEPVLRNAEKGEARTILSAIQDIEKRTEKQGNETTSSRPSNLDKQQPHPQSSPKAILTFPHNPSITITRIQTGHIPALKRLTSTLLPIKYPTSFYDLAIQDRLSFVALYTPNPTPTNPGLPDAIPIGWIRCSLEPYPIPLAASNHHHHHYNNNALYIKTLCLLSPHRHLGIATALLDAVLAQNDTLARLGVSVVFAHVWEANEEALEWYEKRGFTKDKEIGLVEGYYRRLSPGGAWVVWRALVEIEGRN